MDLTEVRTIKKLYQELNIRSNKKLGQNFLVSKKVLDKIIKAGDLEKSDTVLEIGPGFGVLTQELLKYVDNLIVVEKDKRLAEFLNMRKQEYKDINHKDIKIINDDILKKSIKDYGLSGKYKIISNLPYQITSPILWKFLNEIENKPQMMVLMVQKEVAERIVAKPGQMSVLSVMCQFQAECEIVAQVSKENFWPQPEVDSAIIKLKIKNQNILREENDMVKFFKIVKIGFSAKRKMLKNNLSAGLKISSNETSPSLK